MPLPHGTWLNCLNDARRRGVPPARSVKDVLFPGSDPRIAMRATGKRVDTIRYTIARIGIGEEQADEAMEQFALRSPRRLHRSPS
jgi:hypothetical protein